MQTQKHPDTPCVSIRKMTPFWRHMPLMGRWFRIGRVGQTAHFVAAHVDYV